MTYNGTSFRGHLNGACDFNASASEIHEEFEGAEHLNFHQLYLGNQSMIYTEVAGQPCQADAAPSQMPNPWAFLANASYDGEYDFGHLQLNVWSTITDQYRNLGAVNMTVGF